jgi:hypothetical protein
VLQQSVEECFDKMQEVWTPREAAVTAIVTVSKTRSALQHWYEWAAQPSRLELTLFD